jgi:hypothetical protein
LAINAASSVVAAWRCCSPTSSHNTVAPTGLSARSRRSCTNALLRAIIALGPDALLKQRIEHPSRAEQCIQRPQRPRRERAGRALEIRPRGRHEQMAAVRQHHDQLQALMPVHPADQLKRPALPCMPRPHDPDRSREAIEVGLVSCSSSQALTINGWSGS